jgi:hypothetical protein
LALTRLAALRTPGECCSANPLIIIKVVSLRMERLHPIGGLLGN